MVFELRKKRITRGLAVIILHNIKYLKNETVHCARGQGPAGIFRPVFEVRD